MANVNTEPSEAVQVVTLDDHLFLLNLDELTNILKAEDIKDRYVVVVPVAW